MLDECLVSSNPSRPPETLTNLERKSWKPLFLGSHCAVPVPSYNAGRQTGISTTALGSASAVRCNMKHTRVNLALLSVITVVFGAQTPANDRTGAQETQAHGYWIDAAYRTHVDRKGQRQRHFVGQCSEILPEPEISRILRLEATVKNRSEFPGCL